MARPSRNLSTKKSVYIFWEGESEEAYAKFLRSHFRNKASICLHQKKGLFHTAMTFYRGNKRFQNTVKEIDEIWFIFDTEVDKGNQWEETLKYLECFRKLRRSQPLIIRYLMTSCCLEYWLLLHYEQCAPAMRGPAEKERTLARLRKHVPEYQKGDQETISKIAILYPAAIPNGQWTLQSLRSEGMPEERDQRDAWLFRGEHTFTTVHEALETLEAWPDFLAI